MKAFVTLLGLVTGVSFATELKVEVTGIRSASHHLGYALYSSESGFPSDAKRAHTRAFVPVSATTLTDGVLKFSLPDIVSGDYALVVFHDLNGNRALDKNFFGAPKEPGGASNNPKPGFGPPKYADCKFKVSDETSVQSLIIQLVH